jgi:hypothetical protein
MATLWRPRNVTGRTSARVGTRPAARIATGGELKKYEGRPEQMKDTAKRNKAR